MNELRTYVPKDEQYPDNPAYAVRHGMDAVVKQYGWVDFESILMTGEFYEKLVSVVAPGTVRTTSEALSLRGRKLLLWGVELTRVYDVPFPHGYMLTYRLH